MDAARIQARAVVKVVAISLAVIAVALLLAIVVLHVRTRSDGCSPPLFLALALLPAVDRVESLRIRGRKVLPRWLAILLVYVVLFGVLRLPGPPGGPADHPRVREPRVEGRRATSRTSGSGRTKTRSSRT